MDNKLIAWLRYKNILESNEKQSLMIHTGSINPAGTIPLIYFAYGLFNDGSLGKSVAQHACPNLPD